MSVGEVAFTRSSHPSRRWNWHHYEIVVLMKTAMVEVESYWPTLFAKLAEKKNLGDLIANAAGGGAPVAVAVAAAPVAAAAADPAAEEKNKEESEEESDDDMGFSLFD